jgi:hypothetical protein
VFSKSRALPPDLDMRSVISVISRTGSTKADIRWSSECFSRSAIKEDNPEYDIIIRMKVKDKR